MYPGMYMWRRLPCLLLLIACTVLTTTVHAAGLAFHWQDNFSQEEQLRMRAWVEQTHAAMTSIVGPLPFTTNIYFHRRDNAAEPVPWAHTQRGRQQGVHFHVDTDYSDADFLNDWTAPHELSHLIIPYLGKRNAWFAEGFASYMQYQVMDALGVLDASQITARYTTRFEKAERNFSSTGRKLTHMPFAEAAPKLRSAGQYPTMYWGGAVFFWQVNQWLENNADSSLLQALRDYVACCRANTTGLTGLIAALDAVVDATVFSRCLDVFTDEPGFPEFREELVLAPAAQ